MRSRLTLAGTALLMLVSVGPVAAEEDLGLPGVPGAIQQDQRIVGGTTATEDYGFMVSLQTKPDDHRCGGSLIDKKWVLTAAHCVEGIDPKTLQVMLGSQTLSQPGDVYEIKEVLVNPSYASDGTADEALLRLAKPAKYPTLRIADPAEADLWAPGTEARVIGWGTDMYFVGSAQDELREVDVPIVSDADCAMSYPILFGFDEATMVCAGEQTGGKDSCQGDSGGPLIVPDAQGEWMQIGIVSWGVGCAFPVFYGVYGEVGSDPMNAWVVDHAR
jgi:trypsin